MSRHFHLLFTFFHCCLYVCPLSLSLCSCFGVDSFCLSHFLGGPFFIFDLVHIHCRNILSCLHLLCFVFLCSRAASSLPFVYCVRRLFADFCPRRFPLLQKFPLQNADTRPFWSRTWRKRGLMPSVPASRHSRICFGDICHSSDKLLHSFNPHRLSVPLD
jgi:hypothetical protein